MRLRGTDIELVDELEKGWRGAEVWRGTRSNGDPVRVELHREAVPALAHLDVEQAVAAAHRFADQPGLLAVVAAGRTEDGIGYVASPWPDGGFLADRAPMTQMSWLDEVAATLDDLHGRHLLHLDVRPQTVGFVDGRPRLTVPSPFRFGGEPVRQRISELPAFLFTAPPELLGGGPLSPLADIFALAATVYEVITGRPIVEPPPDPIDLPLQSIGTLAIDADPLHASTVSPFGVSALISALSREVADRPLTAGQLAAAVTGNRPSGATGHTERPPQGEIGPAEGLRLLADGDIEGGGRVLEASSASGSSDGHRAFGAWLADWAHPWAAARWFRPLAEQGDSVAVSMLIDALERTGGARRELRTWLGRAAADGDAPSMVRLGRLEFRRGHREEALFWLRRAADEGDVDGMHQLGSLWSRIGHGVKARYWLRLAASGGSAAAGTELERLR